ncbi:flagellar motor protein MotA [Bacillus sp. FJAT-18017]|uniref:MotA/TolQ/ExbB proton channel family protein n=1 Tax=Bacillus sp. FJAT-18017 TaxID=1705566 RepID=UPI0006AED2BF|nr:MotA/TolQ/ExbB proton channel family protein [Bacillus sp. FJAT-18017]ALC92278.1 flagellar motor protein MotA [Bacillus sp. FJAT-18017]
MSSIIGIIIALVAVGVGMVLKGASLSALNNPAAFLIIFGGTLATLLIAFPFREAKKFPVLLKVALFEPKLPSKSEQISNIIHCAEIAKREGILALEEVSTDTQDPFFKKGLELLIDGYNYDFIEELLHDELEEIDKRHKTGALMFSQIGSYAPSLGVLGAVVGLVASLGNLNDVDKLGHSIAAAFIATLLGIFCGYVLWNPIANKLKRISKQEQELKFVTIQGILGICNGLTPSALEKKLSVYVTPKERLKYESKNGAKDDEQQTA